MEDGTRVKEGIISTFDLCIEVGDAESGSLKLVQLIKPKWSAEDIKLKRFTGGITNTLLGCWHKDDLDQKEMVLIRIYGANTDLIIDRAAEMRNIQLLHAVGCARPLYARFANGIAYGFFPGKCVDEITVRDPVISRLIAQEMVKVHSIDPDEVMKQSQIPGPFITQKPVVFDRCWKWLDLIPDKFSDAEKNKRYKSEVCSKLQLRRELEELQPHLESINSPVVFCHNDLLLANIVYNDKKGVLGFIDFEYGAFNYEAYDIGNHFAEYAGVETTDYSLYPDRDYQLKWLQTFLEFKATQKGSSSTKVTDHDVEVLYVQVNKFALVSR
ncbi:Ethanolamine kinase 1 [Lamellibrachia satsuma]|nr:Ethanolamine kinase 1 [Lamellibrachia satsuma]